MATIYQGSDLIKTTYQGNNPISNIQKYSPIVTDYLYYTASCFYMDGSGTSYVEYTGSAIDSTAISSSQVYTAFFDDVSFSGGGFLGDTATTLGFKDVFGLEFAYTGPSGDNTYTLKAQNITIATGAGAGYSTGYIGVVYNNGNYTIYRGSTTPYATGSGMNGPSVSSSYFFINNGRADTRQIVTGGCRPLLYNRALAQVEVEILISTYYS